MWEVGRLVGAVGRFNAAPFRRFFQSTFFSLSKLIIPFRVRSSWLRRWDHVLVPAVPDVDQQPPGPSYRRRSAKAVHSHKSRTSPKARAGEPSRPALRQRKRSRDSESTEKNAARVFVPVLRGRIRFRHPQALPGRSTGTALEIFRMIRRKRAQGLSFVRRRGLKLQTLETLLRNGGICGLSVLLMNSHAGIMRSQRSSLFLSKAFALENNPIIKSPGDVN